MTERERSSRLDEVLEGLMRVCFRGLKVRLRVRVRVRLRLRLRA